MLAKDEARVCKLLIKFLTPSMVDLGDVYTEISDIVYCNNSDNTLDVIALNSVKNLYQEVSYWIAQIQSARRSLMICNTPSQNAKAIADALEDFLDESRC